MINRNKKLLFIILAMLLTISGITVCYKFNIKSVPPKTDETKIIETPAAENPESNEAPIQEEKSTQPQKTVKVKLKETKKHTPKTKQEPIKKPENESKQPPVQKPAEPEPTKPNNTEEVTKKKKLFSYDIKKFSSDPEIIEALKLLEESGEEQVVKNIQKYAMRVKFDDLRDVMYKRESYFAISAYNQYGSRFILVNSMYRTAPTEQLACVIAHESMHTLKSPTLEEETRATKKEADCWNKLRVYSKTYPETKLTARLNKLSRNNYGEIEKQIARTAVYKEQFGE